MRSCQQVWTRAQTAAKRFKEELERDSGARRMGATVFGGRELRGPNVAERTREHSV